MQLKHITLAAAFAAVATMGTVAAPPANYYQQCEGRSGADLLSTLCQTINSHEVVSYKGLWDAFDDTDSRSDGTLIDMYSTKHWRSGKEQCGNYSQIGDCYNREHSFPKSWFNDASPMYTDLYHLYPTDGKVNGQRSNYPFGECANGVYESPKNGVEALGKLGASTYPGYSGKVFEPDDEYKGDFARTYFYMVACYNTRVSSWSSDMLNNTAYPAFASWAQEMLLEWHRKDPVSQKELDRVEAVYQYQNNRNPFIDYPELAEHIWGDKKTVGWHSTATPEPILNQPADGSQLDMGVARVGQTRTANVYVLGSNLDAPVKVSISGTGYTVSPATVSASSASAGTYVEVSFASNKAGRHSATLTCTSGTAKSTVTLTINNVEGIPVSGPRNLTPTSCEVDWVYVGDADNNDCYTLRLTQGGQAVPGYPKAVNAEAETTRLRDLDPETTYALQLTSENLESEILTITTPAEPKSIQFLIEDGAVLRCDAGTPGTPIEVLADIVNIADDITITVKAPFQLSTDNTTWAESITLDPQEDRFYLRIYGAEPGEYTTSMVAVAGDYTYDVDDITGMVLPVGEGNTIIETFETEAMGTYGDGIYQGTAALWALTNAGTYSDNAYTGNNSLRFGKEAYSAIELVSAKEDGIGTISLWARTWSEKDGEATAAIEVSADGGQTWDKVGELTTDGIGYKEYTYDVNRTGALKARIAQTAGKRWIIDDVTITDYAPSGLLDGVASDYHAWTAYAIGGQLIINASHAIEANVYGIDGITYYSGTVGAGLTSLSLPQGLYVVAVDDFARRVLVK